MLLTIAIISQLTGFILLFVHFLTGITLLGVSFLSFVAIMIFLLKERIKEKKEVDENDYRNY